MILRPRILLIAIATGLAWLCALLGPLLALAGWRLDRVGMSVTGLVLLALFVVARWAYKKNESRLLHWANERG